MPSGFVEVSGYSQTDLDAAYQRGVVDGGSAVKGNATAAQVLQGYTFSSASAGSNKIGTMVNRGSVNQQLNPSSGFSGLSGYYSNINIQANANTQSRVMTNSYEDLGADNLVRYLDARNIVSNARQSGYTEGEQDGFDAFVANAENSGGSSGYNYPAMEEVVTVWNSKAVAKDSIIVFMWTTNTTHKTAVASPSVYCTALTGNVVEMNGMVTSYDNWTLTGDVKCDLTGRVRMYKVTENSTIRLQYQFTSAAGNVSRAHTAWAVTIIGSSTS